MTVIKHYCPASSRFFGCWALSMYWYIFVFFNTS